MKFGFSDAAIAVSTLSIMIVFAFTYQTDLRWTGHGLAGIYSLLFSIVATLIGAMIVGRVKRPTGINLLALHKKITIYLAALIVATFIYGVWSRTAHGELLFWQQSEPIVTVVQGWFGLVVTFAAITQVLPCLTARRKNRKLHMILGYTLTIMLVIQTWLGFGAAIIEIAETAATVLPLLV